MDVDLAAPQPDLFAALAANAGQRIRRWRAVEEHRHGAVRRGLRKRIVRQHLRNIRSAAHQHADRLAGIGLQSLFKRGLDGGFGLAAGEDDIAAGDEGADGSEPQLLADIPEVAHRQLAGAADIDRTQQRHERAHCRVLR